MRFDVAETRGDGFIEVWVIHQGVKLLFNTSTYGKTKLPDPNKIFEEINGYFASLSEKTQDALFEIYKEVKNYLDEVVDLYPTGRFLKQQLEKLYQLVSMDDMAHWLLTKGNLYIPSDIRDTLGSDTRYPRQDQTYLKEDYINLSVLSLALRIAMPIWGEFIELDRTPGDTQHYKEVECIGLLFNTEVAHWPIGNSAHDKLQRYIEIMAASVPSTLGKLYQGFGSTEMPLLLLGKVMVRRLTIVPLSDHQVTHSIIANIHRYVKANLNPSERTAADTVNEKRPDEGGGDDGDKTSFMELYKISQNIPSGDVVLFDVYSKNVEGIATIVDPTIDLQKISICLSVVADLELIQIYPHQILTAQWVLAKAFSPRAFNHIKKQSVNRLLAVAQALLWHWQFTDLACFMQVERVSVTDQNVPGIVQRPRSGSRISRKYDNDLMRLYPHVKPQKLDKRTLLEQQLAIDTSINRSNNYAALGINALTRELMRYSWYYCGPTILKQQTDQPEGRMHLIMPPKIKDQITELAIHLATINQ